MLFGIGATEDTASGRVARPGGTAVVAPNPPTYPYLTTRNELTPSALPKRGCVCGPYAGQTSQV